MIIKRIVLMAWIFCFAFGAHAQTWEEWTRQKRTQIKYLVRQVAALQSYIGYVRQGYEIADKGLSLIGSIRDGDFHLHNDFFNALKKVNPVVAKFVKGFEISEALFRVYKEYTTMLKAVRSSGQFTSEETAFIQRVCGRMIEDVVDMAEEIALLLTEGGLQLSDSERLERAEQLCKGIAEKKVTLRWFADENLLLARQRMMEMNDVKVMQKIYNQK